jgi:oxygen-independent coproporphyrinogen-3 oxidase
MTALETSPDREPQAAPNSLALYIHWPFCLAKCPYCDFNSHVGEAVDHDRWQSALLRELDRFADETGRRRLTSIFFGGGTPSLMAPATAAALIERAAERWDAVPDIEITLEANPTSVETGRLHDFHIAGVNRVSLGVQALDDEALAFLGRQHSAAEALAAVATAQRVFPRFSFDLIYARPGQTRKAWREELRRALEYVDDHVSVYQLTFEKGTPFHTALRQGKIARPDDEAAAGLYEDTQEILDGAGLAGYEISNHARAGAESRHNLAYWQGDDYVGIGPGAHGRLTLAGHVFAAEQVRAPQAWLTAVETRGEGTLRRRALTADERLDEIVMMGLRLRRGLDRSRFMERTGRTPEEALDERRLARLVDGGFVEIDGDGLRATTAGRIRLNAVLAALLA